MVPQIQGARRVHHQSEAQVVENNWNIDICKICNITNASSISNTIYIAFPMFEQKHSIHKHLLFANFQTGSTLLIPLSIPIIRKKTSSEGKGKGRGKKLSRQQRDSTKYREEEKKKENRAGEEEGKK